MSPIEGVEDLSVDHLRLRDELGAELERRRTRPRFVAVEVPPDSEYERGFDDGFEAALDGR